MTKPNFTANYPLTTAAAETAAKLSSSEARVIARFPKVAEDIRAAFEAGEIIASNNKYLRSRINDHVEAAYKLAINEKYVYAGLYKSLPEELYLLDIPCEARLIPSFEKKLAKVVDRNHPMTIDLIALTAELRELVDVVEYLKSIEVKAGVKAAAVKAKKIEEARVKNVTDVVYQAVLPLKLRAQDEAESTTRARITTATQKLEEADFKLDVVAPSGDWKLDSESRYRTKESLRAFFRRFCDIDSKIDGDKRVYFAKPSSEKIEELVVDARKQAAAQFEIYVAKLNNKINDETLSASLTTYGNLWCESTLTVVTRNKGTQVWHTKIIVNFSKYDKAFNQFPTRLK